MLVHVGASVCTIWCGRKSHRTNTRACLRRCPRVGNPHGESSPRPISSHAVCIEGFGEGGKYLRLSVLRRGFYIHLSSHCSKLGTTGAQWKRLGLGSTLAHLFLRYFYYMCTEIYNIVIYTREEMTFPIGRWVCLSVLPTQIPI